MGLFTAVFETNYSIRGIQTWQTTVNVKLADGDLEITGVNNNDLEIAAPFHCLKKARICNLIIY